MIYLWVRLAILQDVYCRYTLYALLSVKNILKRKYVDFTSHVHTRKKNQVKIRQIGERAKQPHYISSVQII